MKAKIFASFEKFDWKPGSYIVRPRSQCIFVILPCKHQVRTVGWTMTDEYDETKITLTPSLFCKGTDGKDCWHGFIINGEFKIV